jgi:hypothetical protein
VTGARCTLKVTNYLDDIRVCDNVDDGGRVGGDGLDLVEGDKHLRGDVCARSEHAKANSCSTSIGVLGGLRAHEAIARVVAVGEVELNLLAQGGPLLGGHGGGASGRSGGSSLQRVSEPILPPARSKTWRVPRPCWCRCCWCCCRSGSTNNCRHAGLRAAGTGFSRLFLSFLAGSCSTRTGPRSATGTALLAPGSIRKLAGLRGSPA